MTVCLPKAKPGQIAHFQCGGKATITKIEKSQFMNLWFKETGEEMQKYHDDGTFFPSSNLRIVHLEDPPFDWKIGMAFKSKETGEIFKIMKIYEDLIELQAVVHICGKDFVSVIFDRYPEDDLVRKE